MPPDTKPTPVVSPIAALLKSRKTIVAFTTSIATIIVFAVPSLQPIQGELVTILTILGTVLITTIAWEDSAALRSPTTVNTGSAENVTVNTPPAPGDAVPPPVAEDDTHGYQVLPRYEPPPY